MSGDLNIFHASHLAQIHDDGGSRRGVAQADMTLIADGAVAIRDGVIVAVGATDRVARDWAEPGIATIDATGRTVVPGLVECHSHPLFAGERHAEYAVRLGGASLADVAAAGGGIWSSVVATRTATDAELLQRLATTYSRLLAGGVTTLEAKSGYGLTTESELKQLALLEASRALTPMQLVITFLGAHVVPRDQPSAEVYTDVIARTMLPAVVKQGIAQFQDVTVEDGFFTPQQALRLMAASREVGLPVRVHADAWKTSTGWQTAVEGHAISADHLTYTPDDEIRAVGQTDTIAVVLPVAELIYMTERRANARLLIDNNVPLAVSTDFCSSIHATSLLATMGAAAPWFRLTPGEVLVGGTLNAAYSLGLERSCGSLDVGKRGDVLLLDCPHPNELFLRLGTDLLSDIVIGGVRVRPEKGL